MSMEISATTFTESVKGEPLGITLGRNLNFKNHVNIFCKEAGQTLHALASISKYVNVDKRG